MPRYLHAVPLDPFTGAALKMARTGDGLVSYSVGADLADDSGRPYDRDTDTGDLSLRLGR